MQVTVGDGWSGVDDGQVWTLMPTGAMSAAVRTWHYGGAVISDPCADAATPMPSVAQLLSWLQRYPGLTVTELASRPVSGYPTHLLEIRADSIAKCPNAKQPLAVLWTYRTSDTTPIPETLDYGAAERVLIIDHPDGAVITTISSQTPEDLPLLWERAEPVLESIAFVPVP
jgi:hypothetical protein